MGIKLKFEADDKASREMKKIQGGIKKVSRTTKRETKKMESGWRQVNQSLGKVGLSYKRIGIAVAAMAAAGAYAIGRIGNASIKAASSFEEIESKFKVVFRGVEDIAKETTEKLTEDFGFANASVMQWMSSIQDLLVPMGLARGEAAGLSGDIVKLSIDIGSFNDQPTADVMRDIQSALVGNHETVRKYGVVITEAALKQEAMTQGLNKSWNEMTAAEKVMLRYKLIVKGSEDAVGDFARTQDSWANQSRILQERQKELLGAIGKPLISALSDLQPKIKAVADDMIDWVEANEDLIQQNMAAVVGGMVGAIETVAGWTATIRENWDFIRLANMMVTGDYRDLGEVLGNLNEKLNETGARFELLSSHSTDVEETFEEINEEIAETNNYLNMNIRTLHGFYGKARETDFIFKTMTVDVKKVDNEVEEVVYHTGEWNSALNSSQSLIRRISGDLADTIQVFTEIVRLANSLSRALSNTRVGGGGGGGGGGFWGGLGSFFGALLPFHEGGYVSPRMPQLPSIAPPGTPKYQSGGYIGGGIPLRSNERLARLEVGELVLNRSQQAALGIGGGPTIQVQVSIDTIIGDEEYVMENVIPHINKAARDLGLEVWASDSRRAARIAT